MRKTDKHKKARDSLVYEPLLRAEVVAVTAGREKGGTFVKVGRPDRASALICDGKKRTVDRPKKKNQKHLRVLAPVAQEVWQDIVKRRQSGTADAAIRNLLKQWQVAERKDPSWLKKM